MRNEDILVWPVDDAGFLSNPTAAAPLQDEYRSPLGIAVGALAERYADKLVSVYLRGSVALGRGVSPHSDLDLIAITDGPPTDELDEVRAAILADHPYVQDVDVALIVRDDLGRTPFGHKVVTFIALEARLIRGTPPAEAQVRFRPDSKFASWHLPELESEIAWLADLIQGSSAPASYRGVERPRHFWAKWSMRLAIRATQMIVMLETGQYSNDLESCVTLSSAYRPSWRQQLLTCLEIERAKVSDPASASQALLWWRRELLPLWSKFVTGQEALTGPGLFAGTIAHGHGMSS